jgi:hypothetical protein
MNRIPCKNPQVVWKNLQGETVLLNPMTGKYFGLTKVGGSFWEKIDGSRTAGQIADLLMEEYDVERERLSADLSALVQKLERQELITFAE